MSESHANQRFALRALALAVGAATGVSSLPAIAITATPETYTVTTTDASGPGSLYDAISLANSHPGADTIDFAVTGTIKLTSASSLSISDGVTIEGPGADQLIIDQDTGEGPIFYASTGGSDVTISGLTLTHAVQGAVYADGGTPVTVENVTITASDIGYGGLLEFYEGSSLTLKNSVIKDNNPSGSGRVVILSDGVSNSISNSGFINNRNDDQSPGISLSSGELTVENTTFSNNSGAQGGSAINANGTTLTVTNSTFSGNTSSSGHGGAVVVQEGATATIENSLFDGNSVAGSTGGGAIYVGSADLTVDSSQFSNNSVKGAGKGGAINAGYGSVNITDSAFTGNSADPDNTGSGAGGAVYMSYADSTIDGSVLTGNTASGDGGAIYADSGSGFQMSDSEVHGNQAGGKGGAMHVDVGSNGDLNLLRSVIQDNSGDDVGGALDLWLDDGSTGNMLVEDTTVDGNTSSGGSAAALGFTGGNSTITINRSTFSGNSGNDIAAVEIGAAYATDTAVGTLAVENSTFSANTATNAGAGLVMGPFTNTNVSNATFVDNSGDAANAVQVHFPSKVSEAGQAVNVSLAASAFASSNTHDVRFGNSPYSPSTYVMSVTFPDVNIIQQGIDTQTGASVSGSADESDPQLGPLADNGGYTFTHSLAADSYAVDMAEGGRINSEDQRGATNTGTNTHGDVGAFEYVGNRPPALSSEFSSKLSGTVGDTVSGLDLAGFVTDPDGDNVTIASVDGLPPGLSSTSGVISGTLEQAGTFYVRVVAQDDGTPALTSVFRAEVTVKEAASGSTTSHHHHGSGGSLALAWFSLLSLLGLRHRR